MGGHEQRAGAAPERLLQPLDRAEVQVVRGLVEEEQVRVRDEQPGQGGPRLLAARELLRRAAAISARAEARAPRAPRRRAGPASSRRARRSGVVQLRVAGRRPRRRPPPGRRSSASIASIAGGPAPDGRPEVRRRREGLVEVRLLGEQPDAQVPPALDLARVRLVDARRRSAGASSCRPRSGPTMPTRSPTAIAASIRSRITKVPTSRTTPERRTSDMRQAAPLPAAGPARGAVAAARRRRGPRRASRAAARRPRRRPARRPSLARRSSARSAAQAPRPASSVQRRPRARGAAGPGAPRGSPPPRAGPRPAAAGTTSRSGSPAAPTTMRRIGRPQRGTARRPAGRRQVLLHLAVAVGRRVVVDRRAAPLDRLGQDGPDLAVEARLVGRAEGRAPPERVEPRAPERLVGVDVADPGDERLVEQQRLEPAAPAAQARPERRAA